MKAASLVPASVLTRLSSLMHAVGYEDLSAEVVQRAKALVLDTLGCAFGGCTSGVNQSALAMARELGGTPHSTVIGARDRTSMALATLLNGTALRYLDSNDYYFGRDPAHPSGNLAVALAVGERQRVSGKQFLAAIVAAYEIHLRLCDSAGKPNLWGRGWHHATNAQFSSAALAARLLQDDPLVTAHAMAIAASHHNTLAQLQSGEISQIKATAEAWVAKGGVEAALLAAHGVTGPLELIEGKAGWAEAVAGAIDTDRLLAPIGDDFRLMQVCIKPYPAVATATAPIRAALELHTACRDRFDQIERIVVGLPAFALGTPSADPGRRFPSRRESADHSFYFCVAIALLEGQCGEAQFEEHKLELPVLRALLAKIELVEDSAFSANWPSAAGGAVSVHMNDRSIFAHRCEFQPGHPRSPLGSDELALKFHSYADPILTRPGALRLRAIVDSIEECTDLDELCAALVPATAH